MNTTKVLYDLVHLRGGLDSQKRPTLFRLHCQDLDTAYNQGTKKLERALMVQHLLYP